MAAIMKITIADTDHLSDSWFKTEILGGLNGAVIEFIDTLANDVNMELNKSNGIVDSMGNILRGLPVVGIRIERSQLESSNSQKVLIPQSCVLFLD